MSFTPDSLARLYAMGAKAVASWRAAHEKDRHEALHVYRSDITRCAFCEKRAHDDLDVMRNTASRNGLGGHPVSAPEHIAPIVWRVLARILGGRA